MISSRGFNILKAATTLGRNNLQQVRNSSHRPWHYRTPGVSPPQWQTNAAIGVQGFAWWWILWHLFTEPGHVFGEFEYPDPRKWTNEELGVPEG